jgi:hypothetical protein
MTGEEDLVGNEISCRMLGLLFDELPKKGLSPDILSDWSGYPIKHLRDKHEFISWSRYGKIMENVEKIWNDDELEEMGVRWVKQGALKPFMIIGRLLYTPKGFFRWITNPKIGPGRNMTKSLIPDIVDLVLPETSKDI